VIPGSEVRRRGGYRISPVCRRQVTAAGHLAAERGVDAVVFTGRSRGPGPSEAEQMLDAWSGPEVELVVEPEARTTVENAARTLPLLRERGIERALVVTAPLHVYRSRFFFSRVYGRAGIEVELHPVRALPSPRAVVWELGAAPLCRRQLRSVEAELARTDAP
jgi:uncharacterized SAM-binding protein YcdF (DUF218 family)